MKEHRKRCQLTIVRPRPIIGVGILSDTSKKMLYYYNYSFKDLSGQKCLRKLGTYKLNRPLTPLAELKKCSDSKILTLLYYSVK